MSGPALRQWTAHHAIHEAAAHEVEVAVQMARKARSVWDESRFQSVVEVFLEIVEGRVLVHAEAEEQGLYQEWLQTDARQRPVVKALVAEHDHLRLLAKRVTAAMTNRDYEGVLETMEEWATACRAHSWHEEDALRLLAPTRGSSS